MSMTVQKDDPRRLSDDLEPRNRTSHGNSKQSTGGEDIIWRNLSFPDNTHPKHQSTAHINECLIFPGVPLQGR